MSRPNRAAGPDERSEVGARGKLTWDITFMLGFSWRRPHLAMTVTNGRIALRVFGFYTGLSWIKYPT